MSDILDDHLVDKGVEYFKDTFALGAEFLGLLFKQVPPQVDKEHLQAQHAKLNDQVVDVL